MPASKKPTSYIPTLDGLRAVAIAIVIASHTGTVTGHPELVNSGHIGVLIFFALSGFLITTRLLDEYRSTGRISLRNFYIRRVFRILPPALVYIGVVFILMRRGAVQCSLAALRAAALFYSNYANLGEAGFGHFWSLSVEEHFYLFWPALLVTLGVPKGWRRAAFLIAAICLWRIADNRHHILGRLLHAPGLNVNEWRTDLIADTLLWGCCLAFFWTGRTLSNWASTVIVIFSSALLFLLGTGHVSHVVFALHFLPTLLLGAIVMAPGSLIGRALELPVMRFIGRLSYSLYIWQQLFLHSTLNLPLPWALSATALCALLSYYLIEQPSIRFGRRFLSRESLKSAPRTLLVPKENS
jgi:peptidoglycan/LPS O-acetylase OafA/YrhL